jgi:hypothetical protein
MAVRWIFLQQHARKPATFTLPSSEVKLLIQALKMFRGPCSVLTLFNILLHSTQGERERDSVCSRNTTSCHMLLIECEIDHFFWQDTTHNVKWWELLQHNPWRATQLPLNTFRYAGVSAKNVTLGIPHLINVMILDGHRAPQCQACRF